MDESHKHNVEQKKRESKGYILYDSIYIKFKNRQQPILNVRRVFISGGIKEKVVTGQGRLLRPQ